VVVTAVADAVPDRIRHLVYLDAFIPATGDSALSLAGLSAPIEALTSPPPASFFGLTGEDAEWVAARMTPQPPAPAAQPVRLRAGDQPDRPRTYVLSSGWDSPNHFRANYERARTEPGWTAVVMDGSHDLMIDLADEVADVLRTAAGVAAAGGSAR
jgi:hypothetical protein